jgi:hypothetical protein
MEASRLAATQQNWDYRWQQVPKIGKGQSEAKARDGELVVSLALSTQQGHVDDFSHRGKSAGYSWIAVVFEW